MTTPTYRADGLGPPCAACGARITGTSRTVAAEYMDLGRPYLQPIMSKWTNQPCGHEVDDDPLTVTQRDDHGRPMIATTSHKRGSA